MPLRTQDTAGARYPFDVGPEEDAADASALAPRILGQDLGLLRALAAPVVRSGWSGRGPRGRRTAPGKM